MVLNSVTVHDYIHMAREGLHMTERRKKLAAYAEMLLFLLRLESLSCLDKCEQYSQLTSNSIRGEVKPPP